MNKKTKLCYLVEVDGVLFDVAVNHADEFVALYVGQTIIFHSDVMRWCIFENPKYNWYERRKD